MAFVVAPVSYPVFETVHGDFELIECVGVGNSDVAFAEDGKGGAWYDGDSGFIEQGAGELFGCLVELFNRRKDVKCTIRFDGWKAHVGEPGVDVVAA